SPHEPCEPQSSALTASSRACCPGICSTGWSVIVCCLPACPSGPLIIPAIFVPRHTVRLARLSPVAHVPPVCLPRSARVTTASTGTRSAHLTSALLALRG